MVELEKNSPQDNPWEENLDKFLNSNFATVVLGGFGDKIAIALIFNKLKEFEIGPDEVHDLIVQNEQLFAQVRDAEWRHYTAKYGQYIQRLNSSRLTDAALLKAFRKKRPDLLNVIMTIPGGLAWLHAQLNLLRDKLGIPQETP